MEFEQQGEIYVPTLWDRVQPLITAGATIVMNGGFIVAGLALAYLIYGLMTGGLAGYSSLHEADRARLLANIDLAAHAAEYGLGIGSIAATVMFFTEDVLGYILFFGAAVVGVGIPYICRTLPGGSGTNHAIELTLVTFVSAAYAPALIGALLIARDIVARLVASVQGKSAHETTEFTYGGEAQKEKRPVRMSILAKCWEGPYCREFIRPHCPIFVARKACWKEKRGCYCEEDIVSAAAARINGTVLEMAPDQKYNFANKAVPVGTSLNANPYRKPELTPAQKVERCKYCVIYNEHEREKYKLLVPVVMVGSVVACGVFAKGILGGVGSVLGFTQGIVDRFSFGQGGAGTVAQLTHPNEAVEWAFVIAFAIILLSKCLQVLEWACFKAKI